MKSPARRSLPSSLAGLAAGRDGGLDEPPDRDERHTGEQDEPLALGVPVERGGDHAGRGDRRGDPRHVVPRRAERGRQLESEEHHQSTAAKIMKIQVRKIRLAMNAAPNTTPMAIAATRLRPVRSSMLRVRRAHLSLDSARWWRAPGPRCRPRSRRNRRAGEPAFSRAVIESRRAQSSDFEQL